MKFIPLTQGKFALVDDEDYERLSKYSWHYSKPPKSKTGYARRNDLASGTKPLMHREILNAQNHVMVDHINGDGLINIRANLRTCTRNQNCWNRKLNENNSTGFKGVSMFGERFRAVIVVQNKHISLGLFNTAKDAGEAYRIAAEKYHGDFARAASF